LETEPEEVVEHLGGGGGGGARRLGFCGGFGLGRGTGGAALWRAAGDRSRRILSGRRGRRGEGFSFLHGKKENGRWAVVHGSTSVVFSTLRARGTMENKSFPNNPRVFEKIVSSLRASS
jgi:hypothetical protein